MNERRKYISLWLSFVQLTTASQVADHTPSEFLLRESAAT